MRTLIKSAMVVMPGKTARVNVLIDETMIAAIDPAKIGQGCDRRQRPAYDLNNTSSRPKSQTARATQAAATRNEESIARA